MFIVRLAVLVFWAFYAWDMGQIPPSGLNAFGKFVALSFFFVAPALYLLPTFEAWLRKHRNINSIALVNILLGWTLIGWVVAEAWALKRAEPVTVEASAPVASKAESGAQRECPYCAETILAKAKFCKHCHKEVEPLASSEQMSTADIEALARGNRG